MTRPVRAFLFYAPFALSLGVAFLVFRDVESHWLTAAWLLSLPLFAVAAFDRSRSGERAARPRTPALILAFAALFPVLVRLANLDRDRMHQDEFITAYYSATQDFGHSSFFEGIPEKNEWQGQYPKPYFLLQRIFFRLFGASTLTVRLSVQIYVAVVSLMLFLIVREILDEASALIAVVLYSFLAISIYLESLGLIFISSGAAFTVFFYFAVREYRTGGIYEAAMTGIACGACYLVHYASYIAFPVLLAFQVPKLLQREKRLAARNLCVSLGGLLLVLAPFAAWSLRYGNYISYRANQISLLPLEWSPHLDAIRQETSRLTVLRDHLKLVLTSFAQDGIGGHGGYDFGNVAFFDRFSLALFLAGVLAGLVLAFRRTELFFVFLVILTAFFSGMVMTIPPPAYHRFTVAYPFLAIVMTLPFFLLLRLRRIPNSVRAAMAGGLLLIFASTNQRHLVNAVLNDDPVGDLRLSNFLNQRYPDRPIYVAAFRTFAFQKVFYFRDRRRNKHIESAFHRDLLKKLHPDEKYVYVMIFPDEFQKPFEQADPRGRFFRFSANYGIFAN